MILIVLCMFIDLDADDRAGKEFLNRTSPIFIAGYLNDLHHCTYCEFHPPKATGWYPLNGIHRMKFTKWHPLDAPADKLISLGNHWPVSRRNYVFNKLSPFA